MMEINLKLTKEDADLIADAVIRKLAAAGALQATATPGTNLTEWVRGTDLNKHIKMSKSTLMEYRERGMIGTAKLGGCLYYYLPDINKLLHSIHKRSEYIQNLEESCKSELGKA